MSINIMDIEISENADGSYKVWFVALAGEQGPIVNLPRSLALKLNDRLADALLKPVT